MPLAIKGMRRTTRQTSDAPSNSIELPKEFANSKGFGRPIVALKANDQQLVAVGMTLYHSPTWKTFPDFLADYIKQVLDPAWGNAELVKPFAERHPLIQWYDTCCRYQQSMIKKAGEPTPMNVTGVVACYLGLAYSLYLIKHNVELQERLVQRLKIVEQFQGAYYELVVANILIRAGFELTLEDETDGKTKHCEYAAVSKRTGKKYWSRQKCARSRACWVKRSAMEQRMRIR